MKKYDNYKTPDLAFFGEIPEHWKISRMKNAAQIVLGKMLTSEDKGDYQLKPYLKSKNIGWGQLNLDSVDEMWFSASELETYRIKRNDLLVSEGGEVGKTCIWADELHECYIQNSVHKITVFSENEPRFFLYYLNYLGGAGYFKQAVNQVSIAHLTKEKLMQTPCLTPPLSEQRAITTYLDHKTAQLDTLLAQKETLLRLLHQKRQALINEAVTQGLDPAAPRKPSGVAWLGDVPAHWEVKRLKNICSVRQGLQIPIELRYTEPFEGAFEYITIRSINNPNSPKEYIKSPSLRVICDYDDILMARTGATAEVVKGVKGAFHNNFFLVDYDRAQVLKDYLYYYLTHSSVKEYLKVMAGTTTIPDLNHGEFYETVFPHPPIVEQQAIVNFIETKTGKINEATAAVYTQIKTLKAYRQSLISEVVTGKVDVRTEAQALKGTVPTPSPKEKGSQPTPPRPAAVGQLGLF